MSSIYDITADTLTGEPLSLNEFQGKVLLIVNTASQCGFTGQYEGLEALYRKYKDQGLVVLGFPCNQFGAQEPGDAQEIQNFCSLTYNVSFPMFSKIDVNGDTTHPLYAHLKSKEKGILGTESIKWNFTKFLVNKAGEVVARFAPQSTPQQLEKEITAIL